MSFFKFRDFGLTVKLPLLIVATAASIAVAAALTASYTAYVTSEGLIRTRLSVVAATKRDQLAALLDSVRSDLQSAASNPAVVRPLDNVAIGFKILSPAERQGLRAKYAGDVPLSNDAAKGLSDFYGSAYGALHPWIRSFAAKHGYQDIIFIDRDGSVAYTLAKRSDFGTNVADPGPHPTVLATLFERLKTAPERQAIVTDFAVYPPAHAPAAFVAAPVHQTLGSVTSFVGVLIFQLPEAGIDRILKQGQGFGSQGEALLVGRDGLLRSDSRFGSGHDVLSTRFDDPALIAGGDEVRLAYTSGYRGRMIAAAAPFVQDEFNWSVVAVEPTEEVFKPVDRMMWSIIAACIIAAVILTAAAIVVARRIARPVSELVDRFGAALQNMPHGLCMFDAEQRLILCNDQYRSMYGLPRHLTLPGTPLDQIFAWRIGAGNAPADVPAYHREIIAAGQGASSSIRAALADGRTVLVMYRPIASGGYVATHQDVTEAIRAEERIRHMASHDALTGLPNRMRLRERMTAALARLQQGERFAVLCLDLDRFKAVNDTLGHPVGDLLLQEVTRRTGSCLRDVDTLARLGGDEFVVIRPGLDQPEQAGTLALQLIEELSRPFELAGHQVVIGTSVGVALAPDDGTDVDDLLKNADMALYRAKADGRGSYRFFELDMDARLQRRRQLELDLRHALAEHEFQLSYQPLIDARSLEIVGCEALLRWKHPQRGTVPPADFIPLAEETGLIIPLGEWAVRTACADAALWPKGKKVAVNLSPVQFRSPVLVHTVVSALAGSGLSPACLELEITESALLADQDATLITLHQLRSLGIKIAMDDFGTGYSSLSYLRAFPFDKIKIDRSFVGESDRAPDSRAIIAAVASLGQTLGMVTTAEGVESREQFEAVRRSGCTEVQGYYFSPPLPADRIGALMRRGLAAIA